MPALSESLPAISHSQQSEALNQLRKNGFHLILDNFTTRFTPLIRLGDFDVQYHFLAASGCDWMAVMEQVDS